MLEKRGNGVTCDRLLMDVEIACEQTQVMNTIPPMSNLSGLDRSLKI